MRCAYGFHDSLIVKRIMEGYFTTYYFLECEECGHKLTAKRHTSRKRILDFDREDTEIEESIRKSR